MRNEQKRPEFLRLNPNGRIPAIVDRDGPGGAPLSVFESGAILWYLAEKFPGLMPGDPIERVRALEYTFFQVGGIGPMFGQAGWFARHIERVPLAIDRYQTEARRLTAVLEARLQTMPWLAGRELLGGRHHELRLAACAGVRRRAARGLPGGARLGRTHRGAAGGREGVAGDCLSVLALFADRPQRQTAVNYPGGHLPVGARLRVPTFRLLIPRRRQRQRAR